jgi:hypothetical protein
MTEDELGVRLQWNLEAALEALGYDEDRGDWWSVNADCGEDGWGVKGAIDGRDRFFDVTVDGYQLDTRSRQRPAPVQVTPPTPEVMAEALAA